MDASFGGMVAALGLAQWRPRPLFIPYVRGKARQDMGLHCLESTILIKKAKNKDSALIGRAG